MASIHKTNRSRNWIAAFYLPDGRRAQRSTGTPDRTQALKISLQFEDAAKMAKQKRLTERQARTVISSIYEVASEDTLEFVSVRTYLEQWLALKKGSVAVSSFKDYSSIVKQLLNFFGSVADAPMESITVCEARKLKLSLVERVSKTTALKYLKLARSIWSEAEKESVVRENPFQQIDLPKKNATTRRAFTEAELTVLLKYLAEMDSEWYGIVLFALYSGQRFGDIVCMQWLNIDLSEQLIKLQTQKTGRFQSIPIASPLLDHLMQMTIADDPEAYIFPQSHQIHANAGQAGTLSRQFSAILVQAGIVKGTTSHVSKGKGRTGKRDKNSLSFHSLRHTATSMMKAAGVPESVVMDIIGHESDAVSRAYTHIDMEAKRRGMDKMRDLTGGES